MACLQQNVNECGYDIVYLLMNGYVEFMQQQQQLQKAAMHARSAATTRPIAQPPATPVSLLPVPVPPLPTPVPTPVASPQVQVRLQPA
uniref:Uncharacterized protein n=1 Tax=Oryza glumipatula TaxID=40148 RepID=A0A0E0AZT8_9ORYZ